MKTLAICLIPLAFAAGAVQAQDVGALPPAGESAVDPAPADAVPPASDAGVSGVDAAPPAAQPPAAPAAADAAAVTDAEIESFAKAMVEVQDISADATLDQQAKQQRMAAAVTAAGLDAARFNEIGQATGSDPELQARIRTAMAAHAAANQG